MSDKKKHRHQLVTTKSDGHHTRKTSRTHIATSSKSNKMKIVENTKFINTDRELKSTLSITENTVHPSAMPTLLENQTLIKKLSNHGQTQNYINIDTCVEEQDNVLKKATSQLCEQQDISNSLQSGSIEYEKNS